jgi:predicted metal-dependent enzyme (double-stranded beta helix superfamily)
MENNALQTAIDAIETSWGPLSTELIANTRGHLEELLKASPAEEWLAELHRDAPENRELYRDASHGFVLLAHTEETGKYRPPHDHGRGWVIYAVQRGEMEMRTYARIEDPDGSLKLVQRNSTIVRPGEVQVYLPGDIHDTRCVHGPALQFRFTDRDLKKEEKEAYGITRYVERNGVWTVGGTCQMR